jgi:DNA-binding MarR family transcriptional regulator
LVRLVAMPFEGLLGNGCELRIIEFLLPLKGLEFNLSELSEEISVSRPTVDRIVKKFVKWGLMKIASTHGRTKYYSINENSDFIEVFENLNNRLVEQMLGEEMLYRIGEYRMHNTPVCTPKPMPLSEEVAGWIMEPSESQTEAKDSVIFRDSRDFPNNIIALGVTDAA